MRREPTEQMLDSLADWLVAHRRDEIAEVAGEEAALRYGPRQARHEARDLLRRALDEPRADDPPLVAGLRQSINSQPAFLAWIDRVGARSSESEKVDSSSRDSDQHGGAGPVAGPRRAGRPPWTAELFWPRWEAASAAALPGDTYREVAEHFTSRDGSVGVIDPTYLGKLYRKFRKLGQHHPE